MIESYSGKGKKEYKSPPGQGSGRTKGLEHQQPSQAEKKEEISITNYDK